MEHASYTLLQHLKGREDALRRVTRYDLYQVMVYRSNLFTHSLRVAALTREINPTAAVLFGEQYDPVKAELIALVHDDAEIEFGDIQAGNKSKMTPEQLQAVKDAELAAIDMMAVRYPVTIQGFSYRQLMVEAAEHSSLEAQVVNYADKFDAFGEALHEVFAGNHHFITNVINEYGTIPTPIEYYTDYFKELTKKFPSLAALINLPVSLFAKHTLYDYHAYASMGKRHDRQSLFRRSGHAQYDAWKEVILGDAHPEVIRDLLVPKESIS